MVINQAFENLHSIVYYQKNIHNLTGTHLKKKKNLADNYEKKVE